ncbi:thiamine diphosphate-binding protein [Eremomyces bilateralis CBS 781.70]|uniref:3-methyl-2-oxobutanoate dehydrogenase (2-methylpropanoyl-transferring) n=1 Tax=Eremomyces bilateralis CBS 781.70 TaxID=1392243 RepID=A0A6G1G6K5_9PEZI|nr:thiamine diphosphate-binding protein [Eremomyces bilateralis CBS 781.70]KAF1813469.1 thiamine diphosphate-binding protein [Eremomyces bilateralis CBS 781.70]
MVALERWLCRHRHIFPTITTTSTSSRRNYSTHPPNARLNKPIDFSTTPILHHTASSALATPLLPPAARKSKTSRQNLFQSINSALRHALSSDEQVLLFGEDVAFGGVFRCSMDLAADFGSERVFNTPLTEQGIVGFAIGCAAEGMKPVAEIQFADYVYPAFDQLVNEAAKMRYRAGLTGKPGPDGERGMHSGGLVVRMPSGGVGHGALYHSQSPESLFTHVPGLRVVVPRSPIQAKGMLLSAILDCNDPVVFLEPKILYRAAVEQVPMDPYFLPLDKAEVLKQGKDVTVISYGTPLYSCSAAIEAIEKDLGVSVELIDLRSIHPWDRPTVWESVNKTGRAVIVHESMVNAGVGAEVAATIQEGSFLRLEAPVIRVAGWTTHVGLVFEKFNIPDVTRIYDAIKRSVEY